MSDYDRVRTAFTSSIEHSLKLLDIEVKKVDSTWAQVVCPLCSDTSGSASIATNSGHLKCHQCSESLKLFDWIQQLRGLKDAVSAMKWLAELLHVTLKPSTRRSRAKEINGLDGFVQAMDDLWVKEEAKPSRDFLQGRNLLDREILDKFGVGYHDGCIVFPQWGPDSKLRKRYRNYAVGGRKFYWSHKSSNERCVGIWPKLEPPKDAEILILGGEWDVLTAWIVLRLQDQGIWACCYTAGESNPIPEGVCPEWMRNRKVTVLYDNDTFQGPTIATYRSPNRKKFNELRLRRDMLVQQTMPMLEELGCEVYLARIPMDPVTNWGADLRDWADAGGRDWGDIEKFTATECKFLDQPAEDLTINAIHRRGEQDYRARIEVRLEAVLEGQFQMPRRAYVECGRGQHKACSVCKLPERFPKGLIDFQTCDRWGAMMVYIDEEPEFALLKRLAARPRGCPAADVIWLDSQNAHKWEGRDSSRESLKIVSAEAPSYSGEMIVTGTVWNTNEGKVLIAESVTRTDELQVRLEEDEDVMRELLSHTPWDSSDPDEIDLYLKDRADGFEHMTTIKGRRSVHLAVDLLYHSVSRLPIEGGAREFRRGWLDICLYGDTRTGKTFVCDAMQELFGRGHVLKAGSNISRPGLTVSHAGKKLVYPGLFPQNHGGAVFLDELQASIGAQAGVGREHPMEWLQSARGEGVVHGVKAYGHHEMDAEVRLCVISNWVRQRPPQLAQALRDIYGSAQALARLDFALPVTQALEPPSPATSNWWTPSRARALVQRAWQMTPDRIDFEDGVAQLAKDRMAVWVGRLDDQHIPLFTGTEKYLSVLRIAVACANLCFSHRQHHPSRVFVRKGHVEWAIRWLEWTWDINEYREASGLEIRKEHIDNPWLAEWWLTVASRTDEPGEAIVVFNLLGEMPTKADLESIIGRDIDKGREWVSKLLRQNIISRITGRRAASYVLNPQGRRMVRNLTWLAQNHPRHYTSRVSRLEFLKKNHKDMLYRGRGLDGLPASTVSFDEWESFHDHLDDEPEEDSDEATYDEQLGTDDW